MPVLQDKADPKARFRDNPEAIAQYLNQSLEKNQLELLLAAFALNVPVPWVPRPTPPKLGRPKKATSPEAGD
jgi:hypothetical protein